MNTIHVFLTRPEGRNGSVPGRLRALGIEAVELPALELGPLDPPGPLPSPDAYDAVVFVSRYAVQRYLALLEGASAGAPVWPAATVAATVGAGSAQALLCSGVVPSGSVLHPDPDAARQDSEALFELLLARHQPLRRVLVVRGAHGREWLAEALRARGVTVDFLPVYARSEADWPPDARKRVVAALARPEHCLFLLTSGEGVRAVAARIGELGLMDQWRKAGFVVIHERISATLQSVLASPSDGGVLRVEHCTPDDESIVAAIQAVVRHTAKP